MISVEAFHGRPDRSGRAPGTGRDEPAGSDEPGASTEQCERCGIEVDPEHVIHCLYVDPLNDNLAVCRACYVSGERDLLVDEVEQRDCILQDIEGTVRDALYGGRRSRRRYRSALDDVLRILWRNV